MSIMTNKNYIKMNYSLYTPKQLAYERSIGLEMTDSQNENFYAPSNGVTHIWNNEQFELYLSTKEWDDSVKNNHRSHFNGQITFEDGTISYD